MGCLSTSLLSPASEDPDKNFLNGKEDNACEDSDYACRKDPLLKLVSDIIKLTECALIFKYTDADACAVCDRNDNALIILTDKNGALGSVSEPFGNISSCNSELRRIINSTAQKK